MDGPSTIGSSHGWSARMSSPGWPCTDRPSGDSRSAQMRVGSPARVPSLFHTSQGVPSASTNGLGSIEPPRSSWQMKGPLDVSTNGPCGRRLTASEMHCLPVAACRVA